MASKAAIVLLPELDTPITTMMDVGSAPVSGDMTMLRGSVAIHEPDDLAVAIGTRGGQIFSGEHARQDFPLVVAADEEKHFAARCQRRKRQGHARNERLEARFVNPCDPTLLFLKLRMTGEQRCGMAVRSKAHQHHLEKRALRIEPFRAVKAAQLRFVPAGGLLRACAIRRNRMNVAGRHRDTIEQKT